MFVKTFSLYEAYKIFFFCLYFVVCGGAKCGRGGRERLDSEDICDNLIRCTSVVAERNKDERNKESNISSQFKLVH